ncbi:hypothetical protein DAEQUDRAFT_812182 [Daedalea quercina L-15889]|uniref:F-box domain-containing protein n=1 Tax=Daedalea quercina L-15889 TaxID=1314783 RepID=A0A165PML0_9APHY|nr:hypothetical protein DAEQUDRAFT_812182 [Daedalea quercina L-15889]
MARKWALMLRVSKDAQGSKTLCSYLLPLEIYEDVIRLLRDDCAAIATCRAVCRTWYSLAHPLLFAAVSLGSTRTVSLFTSVAGRPHIAATVRTLSFTTGHLPYQGALNADLYRLHDTSNLFPTLLHMENLEELSIDGSHTILDLPKAFSRKLHAGCATFPMKRLKVCISNAPLSEAKLRLIILASPRLETFLFAQPQPHLFQPMTSSDRMQIAALWSRVHRMALSPRGSATTGQAPLDLSTAGRIGRISTLILEVAEPHFGFEREDMGYWMATATNAPYARIAARMAVDEHGQLYDGYAWDLLRTAGTRLESLRLNLTYHYLHIGIGTTPGFTGVDLLCRNSELRTIFVRANLTLHFISVFNGVLQVLSAVQPAHLSLQSICISLFVGQIELQEVDGYWHWQDQLDVHLARLFAQHPGVSVTLGIIRPMPIPDLSDYIRSLVDSLQRAWAAGGRLGVIWENDYPINSQDDVEADAYGGHEVSPFSLAVEPSWFVETGPRNLKQSW